jgi:heme exporter protein C
MRLDVLKREARAGWVKEAVAKHLGHTTSPRIGAER